MSSTAVGIDEPITKVSLSPAVQQIDTDERQYKGRKPETNAEKDPIQPGASGKAPLTDLQERLDSIGL